MTSKRASKIEILDDSFSKILGPVDSGNLRVTFKSGATLDIYIDGPRLYITGNGTDYEVVLAGGTESDFEITMRKVER